MFINNEETIAKSASNLKLVLQQPVRKQIGSTAGTDENLFRKVAEQRARALPLELLPLELLPVPGHDAQISARAPTKGFVQTGTRAPGMGTSLNGKLN